MKQSPLKVEVFYMLQIGGYYLDNREFVVKIVAKEGKYYVGHNEMKYHRDGTISEGREGFNLVKMLQCKDSE